MQLEPTRHAPWPDLTLTRWADTRDTLHLWTQVVGKIRLSLVPMTNHWWHVPHYVSARGLTTSLMHAEAKGVEIEFDFIDHVLALRTTDGERRDVALQPRSGFARWSVEPDAARFDAQLGEFLLPYRDVRTTADP